jgi:hypothetical protein
MHQVERQRDIGIPQRQLAASFIVALDEIFALRQALAYESRVVAAHVAGRSSLPKGMLALADELVARTAVVTCGAVRAAQTGPWSAQALLVRTGARRTLTRSAWEGDYQSEIALQRLDIPRTLADVQADELLRALSGALDEIYYLRAYAAHCAELIGRLPSYKSFPSSRRRFAEMQIDRLLHSARGWVAKAYWEVPARSLAAPGSPTSEVWRSVVVDRLVELRGDGDVSGSGLLAPPILVAA